LGTETNLWSELKVPHALSRDKCNRGTPNVQAVLLMWSACPDPRNVKWTGAEGDLACDFLVPSSSRQVWRFVGLLPGEFCISLLRVVLRPPAHATRVPRVSASLGNGVVFNRR
jgi:hypothetical protein